MSTVPSVVDEADVIEAGIATANPEQLATLAGWLGRMMALVQLRIAGVGRTSGPQNDRILEVDEVAERLGQSKSWVYAHRGELRDLQVPMPGNRLKFSERKLDKFIERRSG
jgi:predicted DNA-binding transcriptional regulator AlpA